MTKYSHDVFFLPWVGSEYAKGVSVNELPPCKIMIVGVEHYCNSQKHIADRNEEQANYHNSLRSIYKKFKNEQAFLEDVKQQQTIPYLEPKWIEVLEGDTLLEKASYVWAQIQQFKLDGRLKKRNPFLCEVFDKPTSPCGQLGVCAYKTKLGINNFFKLGKEDWDSHMHFRPMLEQACQLSPDIKNWNKCIFFNFFQRGMPYTDTGENNQYHTGTEKLRGLHAFADVFKENLPEIICLWGKEDTSIGSAFFYYLDVLEKEGLQIRYMQHSNANYCIPRIQGADNRHTIPFTVLEYPEKEHKCLLLFYPHPAQDTSYIKHSATLHSALLNYNQLMQWTPTSPLNINGVPHTYEIA